MEGDTFYGEFTVKRKFPLLMIHLVINVIDFSHVNNEPEMLYFN